MSRRIECPKCGTMNKAGTVCERVGDSETAKINPEYMKATHVVLCAYPEAPSFEEQIRHNQEIQEQMEKELRNSSETETYTP